MMFDKFCKFVERHAPELEPVARQAKIFLIEDDSILTKPLTETEIEFANKNFILPFPVVAIEDGTSCIILADIKPDTHGIETVRQFAEIIPMKNDNIEYRHESGIDEESIEFTKRMNDKDDDFGKGDYFITTGNLTLTLLDNNGATSAKGHVEIKTMELLLASGEVEDWTYAQDKHSRTKFRDIARAYEYLVILNSPDRFLLKCSKAKSNKCKPKKKKKMLKRVHERPLYTFLRPKEIREVMMIHRGDTVKNVPHERRRHYRTLKSDFYQEKQGQTIIIAAQWIGESEAQVGNHIYKVMLDI
jgi:hypothetical protein